MPKQILNNILTAISLVIVLTGCATLEQFTLPATQEAIYEFPAYNVVPIDDIKWRFLGSNKYLQTLGFIHSKHYSKVFFGVTPILRDYSEKETEKNIVEYFQNKTLKDFELSPDINLSEQSVTKSIKTIAGKKLNLLKIEFEVKTQKYEVFMFYLVKEEFGVIYNFYIWKEMKEYYNCLDWEQSLRHDFSKMLAGVQFKKPKPEDMVSFNYQYAISDFNSVIDERYQKEKVPEIAKKRDIVRKQLEEWVKLKPNSFEVYALFADFYLFNDKFEKYGEGFEEQKAIDYFNKAISIRKYYKSAYVGLAKLYKATNSVEKAIENYEIAIKISPNDESLYYELGKIYEERKDLKKAKEYYEKAIRYADSGFATLDEVKGKISKWE